MKTFVLLVCLISFALSTAGQDLTPEASTKLLDLKELQFLEDYPYDSYNEWASDFQGVGNDQDNWFFTQKLTIWKIPVDTDLNEFYPDSKTTFLSRQMPKTLKDRGYNHFGDLDVVDGYLFIPVEGKKSVPVGIAVFKASDLSFIDFSNLSKYNRTGWCSINDGILYTSDDEINPKHPITKYAIDWEALKNNKLVLHLIGEYHLEGIPNAYHAALGEYMQGGDFSSDGKYLFLLNGKKKGKTVKKGIWVFENVDNLKATFVQKSSQDGGFNFKFSKGQEPEGLTYWDLTNEKRYPGKGGQLHTMLLNCKLFKKETVSFKHYLVVEN